MDQNITNLFNILFDKNERIDERDDAAIYLGGYPLKEVLEKLIQFASNHKENQIILSSVGESIGEIMVAMDSYDSGSIKNLSSIAKKEALGIIKGKKPKWLEF